MAHNWRALTLTTYPTAFYVCPTGDDTSGTGTPDNPFKSPQKGSDASAGYSNQIILGTGTYTGALFLNQDPMRGELGMEKQTIIDLNGASLGMTLNQNISNLTIKNGTVNLNLEIPAAHNYSKLIFINCVIVNPSDVSAGYSNFIDCEFINCTGFQTTRHRGLYRRCKFINTTIYNAKSVGAGFGCNVLESCDVDAFSNIQFATEVEITEINFNNVRGNFMFQDGTNPDVYVGLAQALTEHPTKVGANNFNTDPLYNDVSKLSLTVQNSSPNIKTGKNGFNVGNCKIGTTYFCDITSEMTGVGGGGTAVFTNLDGTTDKTVNPSFATGEWISGVLTVDNTAVREVGFINYIGKLALDSALGGTSNSQVPDANDYANGTPENRPERLTYYGRWKEFGVTPPSPTVDGDWDNSGYLSAGTWSLFEWNTQPTMDSTFKGNGDGAFDDTDPAKFIIGAKWFQIKGVQVKDTWNNV